MSRVWPRIGTPLRLTRAPAIHAAEARNRCGQSELRNSAFVATWIGPRTANSAISPTIRRTARAFIRTAGALSIAVEGDSVQLHAMVDEPVAELLGAPFLQRFELIIAA